MLPSPYPKKLYLPRSFTLPSSISTPSQTVALSDNSFALLFPTLLLKISPLTSTLSTLSLPHHQIPSPSPQSPLTLLPHLSGGLLLFDPLSYFFVSSTLEVKKFTAMGYFSHELTWNVHQTGDIYMCFFDSTMQKVYTGDAYRFGESCVYGEPGELTADRGYQCGEGEGGYHLKSLKRYPGVEVAQEDVKSFYDEQKVHIKFGLEGGKERVRGGGMWVVKEREEIVFGCGEGKGEGKGFGLYVLKYREGEGGVRLLRMFEGVEAGEINSLNADEGIVMLTLTPHEGPPKQVFYNFLDDYIVHETPSLSIPNPQNYLTPNFKLHFRSIKQEEPSTGTQSSPSFTLLYDELIERRKVYCHLIKISTLEGAYGKELTRTVLRTLDL